MKYVEGQCDNCNGEGCQLCDDARTIHKQQEEMDRLQEEIRRLQDESIMGARARLLDSDILKRAYEKERDELKAQNKTLADVNGLNRRSPMTSGMISVAKREFDERVQLCVYRLDEPVYVSGPVPHPLPLWSNESPQWQELRAWEEELGLDRRAQTNLIERLTTERDEASAECDELREQLRKYGRHTKECATRNFGYSCTCGWKALSTPAEEAEHGQTATSTGAPSPAHR